MFNQSAEGGLKGETGERLGLTIKWSIPASEASFDAGTHKVSTECSFTAKAAGASLQKLQAEFDQISLKSDQKIIADKQKSNFALAYA